MHFDDLGFEATVPSPRASEPALAVGAWTFVPAESFDLGRCVYHRDEVLNPTLDASTRAEFVVRRTLPSGGVGIFVKGVIIPGESAPFAVADWHRAVRLGPSR